MRLPPSFIETTVRHPYKRYFQLSLIHKKAANADALAAEKTDIDALMAISRQAFQHELAIQPGGQTPPVAAAREAASAFLIPIIIGIGLQANAPCRLGYHLSLLLGFMFNHFFVAFSL